MTDSASFAAVDLGASSGRVILGRVGPGELHLSEVHRFRNGAVTLPDGLYWDILGLYSDVLIGLREAGRADSELRGIAVDTWAVDYGLVTGRQLVGNPRHYRDERTATVIDRVHSRIPVEKLYSVNGLQYLPFNTVYQLAAEPELGARTQALLIPDLLGYWLTGHRVSEATNASTTGLLDASTGLWSVELFAALGLRGDLLPPVVEPGTVVGELTPAVRSETSLGRQALVTTVGSHDTASAIVGVPADNPNFAYISCGTWGLVGVELDEPVLTQASRVANFTNERGVDGTVRYLRNVMGLWLLSESIREWERRGHSYTVAELIDAAGDITVGGPTFDPDAPEFLSPGDMPSRIVSACAARGQPVSSSPAAIVRCILDSLALTFAARISDAQRLSGRRVDVVHMVGGGSQNALLCQLTANAAGLPVVAGPVEATAMGNLLVQARTAGVLHGDLWRLRAELRATVRTTTYRPEPA